MSIQIGMLELVFVTLSDRHTFQLLAYHHKVLYLGIVSKIVMGILCRYFILTVYGAKPFSGDFTLSVVSSCGECT